MTIFPLLFLPPASWGLQCMLCGRTGKCQVEECAPGQDLCRTTFMRMWEGEIPALGSCRELEWPRTLISPVIRDSAKEKDKETPFHTHQVDKHSKH